MDFMLSSPRSSVTKKKLWDAIIVGGGPAGYNAALYLIRKGYQPLLISGARGGQLPNTNEIENYLGFDWIGGQELADKFHNHVEKLKGDIKDYEMVEEIKRGDKTFALKLSSGEVIEGKTVILATGGTHRKLNVPGEQLLNGKGVSYCAICDAPFFKSKEVVVVGGGDSAVEAAIDLSKWAKQVHIVHRSQFRAEKVLLEKMFALPNVNVVLDSTVEEIVGETSVEAVMIKNKTTGLVTKQAVDGVFIEIGQDPQVDLVKDLVKLNEQNQVVVDRRQQTSIPGLYASGDVTDNRDKQIIVATAEGAIAALSASEYLMRLED